MDAHGVPEQHRLMGSLSIGRIASPSRDSLNVFCLSYSGERPNISRMRRAYESVIYLIRLLRFASRMLARPTAYCCTYVRCEAQRPHSKAVGLSFLKFDTDQHHLVEPPNRISDSAEIHLRSYVYDMEHLESNWRSPAEIVTYNNDDALKQRRRL